MTHNPNRLVVNEWGDPVNEWGDPIDEYGDPIEFDILEGCYGDVCMHPDGHSWVLDDNEEITYCEWCGAEGGTEN